MDYTPPRKRMRLRSDTKRSADKLQGTKVATTGASGLHITDLPECILLTIFSHLTYTEVLTTAGTCRRFNQICVSVFDHGLHKLKPLILTMCRNVQQARETRPDAVTLRSEHLLEFLLRQVNLVRAMTFRTFYLSDNPCHRRGQYQGGRVSLRSGAKLLDQVYEKIELVASRKVSASTSDVSRLQDRIERWLDNYHDRFEPACLVHPAIRPECRSAMFGSRVVDLLECFEGCDKKLEVKMDAEWCRVKGTYRVPRVFFTCVVNAHAGHETDEPLSFREQRCLHDSLRALVVRNNDHHVGCGEDRDSLVSVSKWPHNSRRFVGLYQGTNQCGAGNLFFYGYFNHAGTCGLAGGSLFGSAMCEVTFEVDLECRTELAPVEMLLAWREEQGTRREKEADAADGEKKVHREETAACPDLTLRLSIDCPVAGNSVNRLPGRYSCLIQHEIQREDSADEALSPRSTRQIHERNLRLEQRVHRTKLQQYELPNSIFFV